jgi:hypothetical protein
MTTAVTVNTHAGWAVEVIVIDSDINGDAERAPRVVPPNGAETFYVHSGMKLKIRELPNVTDAVPAEPIATT